LGQELAFLAIGYCSLLFHFIYLIYYNFFYYYSFFFSKEKKLNIKIIEQPHYCFTQKPFLSGI